MRKSPAVIKAKQPTKGKKPEKVQPGRTRFRASLVKEKKKRKKKKKHATERNKRKQEYEA